MLKIKRGGRTKRQSLKWGGLMMAVLVAFAATVGFFEPGRTQATDLNPAEWTVTSEEGLTFTVVTLEQGGLELAPIWSDYIYNENTYEYGGYYFQTTNNADKVRVGVRVNGMEDGRTYRIFDGQVLTSADNDQVIYSESRPRIYNYNMSDGLNCWTFEGERNCAVAPLANEYVVGVTFQEDGNWSNYVSKNMVLRPDVVGSYNVEIVSLKQNGTDLYLDKNGRQITSADNVIMETINEYAVDDYSAPVDLVFKLKHLEIGKRYSFDVAGHYESFKADAEEMMFELELGLDYVKKHIDATITVYITDSYEDNDRVPLYFRVTDENFVPMGDIVVDALRQNGNDLAAFEDTSGYRREYTFAANDVQPIEINMHAIRATADLDYYISYNMYGSGAYINADEPMVVHGDELENGVVLTIPSGFGLSESSPMTLSISVSATESTVYSPSVVIYQEPQENGSGSDGFLINYFVDEELPRFTASIGYTSGNEEISDVINARYHDAEHPLWVRVEGERYDNNRSYEVRAKVATGQDNNYYSATFMATGAELNEGKTFVLEDLVLNLPVFDPSGETSGYELFYDFSLEIDGLRQSGTLFYMYDGFIYSVMTYAGGKVAASSENGMGGIMYMSSYASTVRRASLGGDLHATLHYLGAGFDDDLDYDYALYYNADAGGEWWSAPAGNKFGEGTMSGRSLNNGSLYFELAVPDGASESSMYSLVITRNGGLVIVVKDFLVFTDEPQLESFAFNADSESFLQTGAASYRLARGADATATLKGAGFEEAENYRLWVDFEGYRMAEEGYYNPEVDLGTLNRAVVVTGAQLNAGYEFALSYDAVLDEADYVDISFLITDIDGERPDRYSGERNYYNGHIISINYVAGEDVFNTDSGFVVDPETSEIERIIQPIEITIDDYTMGDAELTAVESLLNVASDKACLVIGQKNGAYERVVGEPGAEVGEIKNYSFDLSGYTELIVVFKGDGDLDGMVSTSDSNLINRSLLSESLRPYRELSELEQIILDLDADGEITSSDSNLLNRSLISDSLRPYKAIEW